MTIGVKTGLIITLALTMNSANCKSPRHGGKMPEMMAASHRYSNPILLETPLNHQNINVPIYPNGFLRCI